MRWFLTLRISQIQNCSYELCNGRCPWDVFINIPKGLFCPFAPMGKRKEANPKGGLYKLIGVGSALLVLLQWAMREPRSVGRVTGTDLHAFFVVVFFIMSII